MSEAWARLARRLMWLALVLGIGCRVAQYAADRSYWGDEGSIVLNIRGKTVRQLLGPLDYAQAAPPLYLLAERALFIAFGGGEMSLRLLQLGCGIVGLIRFARLSRRVLPSPWDALATLVFALSDRLIYHDTEVKPYGSDVFVCALLLLMAVGLRAGMPPARRMAWLAGATFVAVWFSFPAVLVFTALSLALMPSIVSAGRRGFACYVLLNLPVVASFAIVFFITQASQHDVVLIDYWRDSFVNWQKPWGIPYWIPRRLFGMCEYAFPGGGVVILPGAIMGAITLFKQRRTELLTMTVGPVLVTMLIAAVHRYPFDGARLTLFLSPCILIVAMVGLIAFFDLFCAKLAAWAWLPIGYLVAAGAVLCGMHLIFPRNRGHLRPVAAFVHEHFQPDDTIYVFDQQAFRCYWDPVDPRLRTVLDRADEIPSHRFWIVWSFSSKKGRERPDVALNWARQFCRQEAQMYNDGGAAVLFERQGKKMPAMRESPYRGIDIEPSWRKSPTEIIESTKNHAQK